MKKPVETKFKLNALRLMIVLLGPFVIFLILLWVIYSKYSSGELFTFEGLMTPVLIIVLFLLPWLALFFNHLKFSKGKALLIDSNQITFLGYDKEETVVFSDIKRITRYESYRMPWYAITKWEFETSSTVYFISSLTISIFNFDRFFYEKTDRSINLYPLI